jgi:hypothetical protein
MSEVILETAKEENSSKSEPRNKLQASSHMKAEKNLQPKKSKKRLTEDEFYSNIQGELRKKGIIIPANVFTRTKNMTPEERRKEAGKLLYLARYE